MHNYGAGSSRAPYQGYPYTNPTVTDVPSIDAATAAKWSHLPRTGGVRGRDSVFVDIPGSSSSSVSQPNTSIETANTSKSDDDRDENPVVYIDFPENSGSDVADRRPVDEGQSFVQDTIFYDQFKDRRIEIDRSDSEESSAHSSVRSTKRTRPDLPPRPPPPKILNLGSPDRGYASSNFAQSLPSIISKEASIYGAYSSDDGFNLQPIPVRDFPAPPPAYSEFDTTPQSTGSIGSPQILLSPSRLQQDTTPTQTIPSPEPPRTQVIVNSDAGLTCISDRKLITCPHCGLRDQSLIVRQIGLITHLIAFLFLLIGLFPITILAYCTNYCKYVHHYCKHCNSFIAYEIPIIGQDLTFVKT